MMIEQPSPRIIPRSEHPVSRSLIDPDALKVLRRLQSQGFIAYLVGGCVRDLILGKTPKDFDIATDADPQQIREIFRNSRLIGRRFRLAHVYFRGGKTIEVSTFRRRSDTFEEPGEDEHPQGDNTFGSPGEDAFRRDITINGIFYNIADFTLVDFVGGLEDLKRGIIRCIGDPEEKFPQDPVRMIRVIRHAARTGFTVEEETYRSLVRHVDEIRLCSPSRVRDEFLRELREGSARRSMEIMIDTGMLHAIFPPFRPCLAEGEQTGTFLQFSSVLDDLAASDGAIPEELVVSVFLLPFFRFLCPQNGFPAGWKGQAAYQEKVRDWIMETLLPLQFPRRLKDQTSHLLETQRIFHECLENRKLPARFMKQSFFTQALRLFEIEARIRGLDATECLWQAEERKGRRKRKRRRSRHKRSPQAPLDHRQNPAGISS
jgi:poly(A) polymerase